jgi:hypothetical protein
MSLEYVTLTQTSTAFIQIPGYMMNRTSAVYLSSNSVVLPGSAVVINDYFTVNPLVSSLFPTATANSYSKFRAIDANHLQLNVYGLTGSGYVDALFYNAAGYTKLSDRGFQVVLFSGTPISTEDNRFIVTESDSPIIVE